MASSRVAEVSSDYVLLTAPCRNDGCAHAVRTDAALGAWIAWNVATMQNKAGPACRSSY
jgi:hypothetical protein